MAYTMTHILAAEKVLEYLSDVKDVSTYILGTIAPDAVHAVQAQHACRNDIVKLKEKSHLFTPGLKWGEIGDEEKAELWLGNVKKFYLENRSRYNIDFLLGYVVHLLVDIYSSMHFYAPFIKSVKGDYGKAKEKYKRESYVVNYYFFCLYREKRDLQSILHAGKAVTLEGVIKKEDIERRKNQLFEFEFQDWDISRIDEHTICRIEDMERIISGAAQYCRQIKSVS